MEEIRKNHRVELELKNGTKIEGFVQDYSKDRVSILIDENYLQTVSDFRELDLALVSVKTHIGVKKMFSHVIDSVDKNNIITIENNDVISTIQRREHVRVFSNLRFEIEKEDGKVIRCDCDNISGGGIAFFCDSNLISLGEKVEVIFPEYEFEKEIICCGTIIKVDGNRYVVKFDEISAGAESKIVKYVFRLIAEK